MSLVADIASTVTKSLQILEDAVFSPKALLARAIEPSEAFALVTLSYALGVVAIVGICIGYLAIFQGPRLATHAGAEASVLFAATTAMAGIWMAVGLIAATIGSGWSALLARALGGLSASSAFPKLLIVYALEWFVAIPTSLLFINDDRVTWPYLLFFMLRLFELAAFGFVFRVGCSLSVVRTVVATVLGALPAVALAVGASHLLLILFVGRIMLDWD